ncbi:MAG: hypothetical protein A2252_06570 [Elusimicrobia bacterium RIFOXYA2_FULL_39_19]|nr:MAG: hypothetical protein A2252_06570 [Elusimicrobia bacterium RIFOXYA2_FULL_39_19]
MEQETVNEIEKRCNNIKTALSETLKWRRDDRFELLLAEFKIENIEKVTAVLATELEQKWDAKTISSASKDIQKINKQLGGLRDAQLLYTANINSKVILLCAWWPWGNNQNVSIRVGLKSLDNKLLSEINTTVNIPAIFGL